MKKAFESIVNSFLKNKVGISDQFISEKLATHLIKNLVSLNTTMQLHDAGIGNNNKLLHDSLIRSDKIYWLDRMHKNKHENIFLDLIEEFINHLNKTCYTGITGYEFHYALYNKGTFYKRHLDQFLDNKNRAFTMIIYLNIDWQKNDGGELCIYHTNYSQIISPNNRKCVFFKSSELEHEVLLCNKQRLSITGWLKTN